VSAVSHGPRCLKPKCERMPCTDHREENIDRPKLRSPLLQSKFDDIYFAMPDVELTEASLTEGDVAVSWMAIPTGGLNKRHVTAFSFAMVCAGPFGVESCIRSFGAAWSCLGFVLTAVIYCLPQIFMTSELSMMLPVNNGGVVAWVQRAFGKVVAATVALNMIMYQMVDLATYPTLVLEYAEAVHSDFYPWIPALCSIVVLLMGLALNLCNVEVATNIYMWLVVLILLPFIVGVCISVPCWPVAWEALIGSESVTGKPQEPRQMDFNVFLSTMMWLNTGWDSMGNLASEVKSPVVFVQGLTAASFMIPLLYVVCTIGALAAGPGSWDDGYLAVAYGKFWPPLTPWIVTMAGVGNFLLYVSELTCIAHLLQSMGSAEHGEQLLPKIFARKLTSGAPVVALLVVTLIECGLVVGLNFDYLVQLSTLLHVFAFWFSLAAFLHLKFFRSDVVRLWSVPGGVVGALAIAAVKVPVLTIMLVSACTKVDVIVGALFSNGAFALLIGLWMSTRRSEHHNNGHL